MRPQVNPSARMRVLAEYEPIDGPSEAAFDDLVRLAADSSDSPAAMIVLQGDDCMRLVAQAGLDSVRPAIAASALCDHALRDRAPHEVADLLLDERLRHDPLVSGEPHARHYYGHPLVNAAGHVLGALCVTGRRPRELDDGSRATLARLAGIAMSLLEGRRHALEAARLAASVDQDDDEIYILREPDLRVRFMNARARAAARLKGLPVPHRWGFDLARVVGWTDLDAALLAMERLYGDDGQHAELETTDDFGADAQRPVLLRMSRTRIGAERSVMVRVRDLTERRATEAVLDENRERWRFAIETCGVGVLDWDFESGTGHASSQARRLFGAPPGASGTLTRTMWERRIHPDDLGRVLDAMDAHLRGQAPDYAVEYRMARLDGRAIRVREHGRVLHRTTDGAPLRMVALQHELDRSTGDEPPPESVRGAVDPAILRTEATLESLRRQLDLLTASLAHDVRAPLHALRTFLDETVRQQAGADRDDHDFADRLAVALEASGRLERIVLSLIDYARGSRGTPQLETIDLRELFRFAWQALPGSERVVLHLEAMPVVPADPTLLRIVADNLLSNAIKYTRDAAHPMVQVHVDPAPCAGQIRVTVRDNGAGFPADQAHRLFEPFQRLHAAAGYEGIGLGLASVRAVVERLGGRCGALANPDGGAAFWFTLPCPPAPESERSGPAPGEAAPRRPAASGTIPAWKSHCCSP